MITRYSDHAANERTFLAWVRTAIAMMAFGFVIERFDLFLRYAAPLPPNKRLLPMAVRLLMPPAWLSLCSASPLSRSPAGALFKPRRTSTAKVRLQAPVSGLIWR